jgi:putative spermidine/putrescine transport system permease protein
VREWCARNIWLLLTLPAVSFMAIAVVFPVGQLLLRSVFDPGFTLANLNKLIAVEAYGRVLLNSFRIAAVITLFTLLCGYPFAYVLSAIGGWCARVMMIALVLPLWTSDLVRTFAWVIILGRTGPINSTLQAIGLTSHPLPLIFNEFSTLVGAVHIMLPFMILPLYSAMRGIDRSLIRAALAMGANPLRTFLHIYLPLSMSGVVAGCLLVFVLATGLYITPEALGGTGQTMVAQLIDTLGRRTLNWGLASAVALALFLSTAIILLIYNRIFGLDRPIVPQRGS